MPVIKTGPRVVVSVVATGGGDWQVASTPTGFQGITSALFADNDFIHGFVRFENGVDWEEYDTANDASTNLLQIANITGTVTITRPAVPYASSNGGARVTDTTGTHTLAISLGSGTMRRILRELNGSWKTFTSGDATPDVADYRLFKTAGTTTITAFDGMEKGKLFVVQRGASDITIADGATISLPGDRNLTLTANQPAALFVEDGGIAVLVATFPSLLILPNGVAATELTIASGAITPTQAAHSVDTEADAATDDLTTITATNFKAGDILTLYAANAARTVVIKATGGNIVHPDGVDVTLDEIYKTCILRYDGTNWNVANPSTLAIVPNALASTILTIATGAITPIRASHVVAAETGTADDLATITGTNFKTGDVLILSADTGDTITVKASGGNILLPNDIDIILNDTEETVVLRYNGTNWNYVAGASSSITPEDIRAFGALIDGATDDTTAWNNAIASLNAGTIDHIWHPGGTSIVSGSAALTTITANGASIRGVGELSRLMKPSGATNGEFLKFGAVGAALFGFILDGISFEIHATNTVSADHYVLEGIWINGCNFRNIWMDNCPSTFKFTKGGLCNFEQWDCDADLGANAAANIYIGDCAVNKFENVNISTTTVNANTNATGKIVHIQTTPSTSGSVDTLWFINCGFQIYNAADLTKSKPYGIYIDRVNTTGNSSITNFWWINSYCDHTSIAALADVDAINSGSDTRLWAFRNFRFATDSGDGITLTNSAENGVATPQDRANMSFNDGYIVIKDDSQAFYCTGYDYDNCKVDNLTVAYRTTTAKTKMLSIDANGWAITNISIQPDSDSTETPAIPTVGVQIEDETLSEIFVDNIFAPEIGEPIREPVGFDHASNTRVVRSPRLTRNMDKRRKLVHYEDFLDNATLGAWQSAKGSDAQCVDFAGESAQIGGVVKATFGNDAVETMAVNGVQLTHKLASFRANVGGLRLTARVRVDDLNCVLFIGFTDTTALENPFSMAVATLTSNATDACGFLYDLDATSANWLLVGVATDVDATTVDSAIAAGTTNVIFEVEIDTSGTMKGWINGVYAGSVASAVTASVLLTPYIGGLSHDATTGVDLRIDYIEIEQDRF